MILETEKNFGGQVLSLLFEKKAGDCDRLERELSNTGGHVPPTPFASDNKLLPDWGLEPHVSIRIGEYKTKVDVQIGTLQKAAGRQCCDAVKEKHRRQVVLMLSTIVLEMRTHLASVGDLIFGQTRGRVLWLLYGAPDEAFFVRQIARQVETSVGTVQRELALLADAGLIKRSAVGSRVFYQANQDHPEFPELRALLAKTTGVFQILKAALAPLSSRISLAFVYGSVARGEEKAASDIDLMVIGAISLDEALDAVGPVEKQLRRPVNPTIYSLEDVRARLHEGNHFLQSLKKSKKVFLIGDEIEFRKVSTTQLVEG